MLIVTYVGAHYDVALHILHSHYIVCDATVIVVRHNPGLRAGESTSQDIAVME